MFEIKVSQEIKNACPVFAGAAVYAAVKNTAYCEGLWKEINAFTGQLTSTTQMEDIKRQPVIAATREAYKRCGKDPTLPSVGRSLASSSDAWDSFISD